MKQWIFVLAINLIACPPVKPIAPTPPPVHVDPVFDDSEDDPAYCGPMCSRLAAMGCPEGSENIGDGCTIVCQNVQSSKLANLRPQCVSLAANRAAVRACGPSIKCLE